MPVCNVYVGNVGAGDFSWTPSDEAYRVFNLPERLGPHFPQAPDVKSHGIWSLVFGRIKSGEYRGEQVDWGAWAAIVRLSDIHDLVNEVYPGGCSYAPPGASPEMYAHLESQLLEFRAFIATLDEDEYIIVAVEN